LRVVGGEIGARFVVGWGGEVNVAAGADLAASRAAPEAWMMMGWNSSIFMAVR